MQDASPKQQKDKNKNPIISRQNYHLTQLCPSEEKQTNKNSAQFSPCTKLTQTAGPSLGGQKPKGRKNSTLKPGKRRSQTQEVKKKKKQRNTAQIKEQTRNAEVQINEEEISKLPEKEFRKMIVKMIKNLEKKIGKNARIN